MEKSSSEVREVAKELTGGVNMDDANKADMLQVNFLGEVVEFPVEVTEYVRFVDAFSGIQAKILRHLASFAGNAGKDPTAFIDPIKADFEKEAKKTVKALTDDGIYDTTQDELLNSTVYREYDEATKQVVRSLAEIKLRYFDQFIAGVADAERRADSKVQGSGMMLISSSITSHLVFSAVESGILSSQVKEAQTEYQEAIDRLIKSNDSAEEKETHRYMAKTAFPQIETMINIFPFELMDVYLRKLEQHGKFAYSKVAGYDMKRSLDLLKNLKMANKKEAVLIEAFKACPYNPEIYSELTKYVTVDLEIYKIAELFCRADGFKEIARIRMEYAVTTLDMDEMQDTVPLLAYVEKKSSEDVLSKYLEKCWKAIVIKYRHFLRIAGNWSELHDWMRKNIGGTTDATLKKTPEFVKNAVQDEVDGALLADTYSKLINAGFTGSISDLIPDDVTASTIDEVNLYWRNKLVETTTGYIEEAKSRKQQYEEAVVKCEEDKKTIKAQIDSLTTELEQQGLFAFSKKKALKEQIQDAENRLSTAESRHHLDSVKKRYETMSA